MYGTDNCEWTRLAPGHILGVKAVGAGILVDDVPQPDSQSRSELLVVLVETGVLNITACQNYVLGGGYLEEEK